MKIKWLAFSILALCLGVPGWVAARAQDGPPPPGYDRDHDRDRGDWDAVPGEFREIQRQGFHDGIEAARRDFDHHRAPDVDQSDRYRHPHVSRDAREDYREGFRRGYERAMNHLMGDRDHDRDHDHDHDHDHL